MKKTLLLTGVLLALTASLASAAGLSLGWANPADLGLNTCPSSPQSLLDVTNACTTNSGAVGTLIGSIVAPPGLTNVVGQAIIITYQESGSATGLKDWWKYNNNECRGQIGTVTPSASLNAAFDPLNDEGLCNNNWGLAASGASAFQSDLDYNQNPSPGRGRISGAFAVAQGSPWPAGSEWYSFRLSFDRRHTVAGTLPVCVGCLDGVCFGFNYANINQPAGTPGGDATVDGPAGHGQTSSYRGGGALLCASATPARRATWGQVKSLYR